MNANELRTIARGSIDEAKVEAITEEVFRQAIRVAQQGKFSTFVNLRAHATDPLERTTEAERAVIIQRLESEGFRVRSDSYATKLHWD